MKENSESMIWQSLGSVNLSGVPPLGFFRLVDGGSRKVVFGRS